MSLELHWGHLFLCPEHGSYPETITHRTLTRQLRELEEAGLINRVTHPVVPPKVEYSLTEKGQSLTSILFQLGDWGSKHM
ncbi:winged helix-turn-helix transcriptional regulator [Paenibacillus sp. UASWS1643]|uniref:winged helix-turn-helix transcriptional regulator n=1 Tax=Paenibacillus sp. UASWS1643 TaxID=2580422 RepID=UPI0012386B55|nr:helix-turn-helix domain-containing protein [Paenibacillus sp. UASWS1643]KAA8745873.1 helix-turn-helix transcriptional regulator [Paenibacillus sp. UASWS1643]